VVVVLVVVVVVVVLVALVVVVVAAVVVVGPAVGTPSLHPPFTFTVTCRLVQVRRDYFRRRLASVMATSQDELPLAERKTELLLVMEELDRIGHDMKQLLGL
jgi:hypothetical protein